MGARLENKVAFTTGAGRFIANKIIYEGAMIRVEEETFKGLEVT